MTNTVVFKTEVYNMQAKKFEVDATYSHALAIQKLVSNVVEFNFDIEKDLEQVEISINPNLFICGRGGHHIWISDKATNKRIAIIYYQN